MAQGDRLPIDAQSVDAPLSRFAIFLVVAVAEGDAALTVVREVWSPASTIWSRPSDSATSTAACRASSASGHACGMFSRRAAVRPSSANSSP